MIPKQTEESKIDIFTIVIVKRRDNYGMAIHHWDEMRHLKTYIDTADNKHKRYLVTRNELALKIAELQNEFDIKDQDIVRHY